MLRTIDVIVFRRPLAVVPHTIRGEGPQWTSQQVM